MHGFTEPIHYVPTVLIRNVKLRAALWRKQTCAAAPIWKPSLWNHSLLMEAIGLFVMGIFGHLCPWSLELKDNFVVDCTFFYMVRQSVGYFFWFVMFFFESIFWNAFDSLQKIYFRKFTQEIRQLIPSNNFLHEHVCVFCILQWCSLSCRKWLIFNLTWRL